MAVEAAPEPADPSAAVTVAVFTIGLAPEYAVGTANVATIVRISLGRRTPRVHGNVPGLLTPVQPPPTTESKVRPTGEGSSTVTIPVAVWFCTVSV
jgi:hypothetical protein